MKISALLHYASFLKWLVLLWMLVLILSVFFNSTQNIIEITSKSLFIAGVYMTLDSLTDISKISEKDKALYSNPKIVKKQKQIFISGAILLFIISILFFSIKFFTKSNNSTIDDISNLGKDTIVMMLGFLCLLKNVYDKEEYVKTH
jgi:hypothetical protein